MLAVLVACATSDSAPPSDPNALRPGEVCDPAGSADLKLRFDPPIVVLGEGATRPVRVVAEPDLCEPVQAKFSVASDVVVDAPAAVAMDLRHPIVDIVVTGKARGVTKITVKVTRPTDANSAEATLEVEVRAAEPPTCSAPAHGTEAPEPQALDAANGVVRGADALATAQVAVPKAAFERSDFWSLPPFAATVACEPNDLTLEAPGGLAKLGPAVTFSPAGPLLAWRARILRREVEYAIPVNPAAMPTRARMRHVQVLYRSPLAKRARVVPVRDVRFARASEGWVMKFSAPFFGTFQAAVAPDAGTRRRMRRITHRALFGFSMGGGGAASIGLRNHTRFDGIAPLGGASDLTWVLHQVDDIILGGFCPSSEPNCTRYAPDNYPNDEPLVHTSDFNHFWYETGGGNGGSFTREAYGDLFTDLSLMLGATTGQSEDTPYLVRGLKRTDPFVTGNLTDLPPNVDCSFSVSPGATDDDELYRSIADRCRRARCDKKNTWIAKSGYYDDEYNPDGTQQVISFCDGVQKGTSPYLDTWAPPGSGTGTLQPLNFLLAVDVNKNGVRDENEPVIRKNGHEPYDDVGTDGLPDDKEPGFDPIANPDPNQDDYDPQVNPTGTERDFRFEPGEPFRDDGLDGVPNTKSLHIAGDPGEGDGVFTETHPWQASRSVDGSSLARRLAEPVVGPLDDAALERLDVLSDGGVRDLFNFGAVARHFHGAVASRRRADGTPLRGASFYSGFDVLPGQRPGGLFAPPDMLWDDIAAWPSVQYGKIDATPAEIQDGDGQHVGTTNQLLARLQMAFYYLSRAWPDADRVRTEASNDTPAHSTKNELGIACEIAGRCQKVFTGAKSGRTGPVSITLPPGYAHRDNQSTTYPVMFVTHGYGQEPRNLETLAIVTGSYMNDGTRSSATRLAKSIVVYVDGRCRVGKDGAPECIRGNFYLNARRPGGPQNEAWMIEMMDYVDQNYRTMAPTDVEVID